MWNLNLFMRICCVWISYKDWFGWWLFEDVLVELDWFVLVFLLVFGDIVLILCFFRVGFGMKENFLGVGVCVFVCWFGFLDKEYFGF